MKNLFIVNPAAGQVKVNNFLGLIKSAGEELEVEYEIYLTKGIGDGLEYARQVAKSGQMTRIFSCGGDGTLNEILNGTIGFPNIEIATIPTGTGNDFVRNFKEDFSDIKGLIRGAAIDCDAIRYQGDKVSGYCANMFNIGFDCSVVNTTVKLKKKPFLKGPTAYLLGVLIELVKKKGANLSIEIDGNQEADEKILLVAIGNGSFCGGGIKGVPRASVDDGLLDVSIIRNIPRRRFAKLFPLYKKGTHLEAPKIDEVISYYQCREVLITPREGDMLMAVDGELVETGPVKMSIVEKAFKFVIPLNVSLL